MISFPDISHLEPTEYPLSGGNKLFCFHSSAVELIKIDFTFPAGSVFQTKKLCAGAANKLFAEGTMHHTAQEIAEFLDYRGIVIEKSIDIQSAVVTAYTLRRYADELLELLHEMFTEPLFGTAEYDVFVQKRRQELKSSFQKTSYVARNRFYEAVYGPDNVNGQFATVDDIDRLTLDDVKAFYCQHYRLDQVHFTLSGNYDDVLLQCFDRVFGQVPSSPLVLPIPAPLVLPAVPEEPLRDSIPSAVQATIRVGRVLPFAWRDLDYSRFMILSTVLGGYFGSRLMSNIREEKGYTYGIYSQTQIFYDSILFYIAADVGAEVAEDALHEVFVEIERLQKELIGNEELELVKNYMVGDFIRSIDGIFERSERYRQMFTTHVTEQFTRNYREALATTTPEQLQQLAERILDKQSLAQIVVGPKKN